MFEILGEIKARPGMYIGKPSVSDLFVFLVGYKTARRELGIDSNEEEINFYEEFHEFVERRYKVRTSNSWPKMLMLYCHEQKDGFERFFNLLDEFKQRDKSLDPQDKIIKSYEVVDKS